VTDEGIKLITGKH